MDNVLLTIAVPTYNRANYLKKCLESIVFQDGFDKDVEILISHDFSGDNTEQIVRSFQEKFQNIQYRKNNNRLGIDKNIQILLENFHGDYCFFLGDDDVLLPNSLRKLKEVIQKNPDCSLITSSYEVCNEKTKELHLHCIFPESKKIFCDNINDGVKIFFDSYLISRLCLKREAVEIKAVKKYLGSEHAHLYLIGLALLRAPSYYFRGRLIQHLWSNNPSWSPPDDYWLRWEVEIIKDLSKRDKKFSKAIRNKIIDQIWQKANDSVSRRDEKFKRFVFAVLRTPELRFHYKVWFNIFYGFLRQNIKKSMKFLHIYPFYKRYSE